MIQPPNDLLTTSIRTATLRLAPAQAIIPSPSSESAIYAIHRRLVALHYLGVVALYGPPPEGVTVRFANVEKPHSPRLPTYIAQLDQFAPTPSVEWLLAFSDGLDRWDEFEMADPLTIIPPLEEDGDSHVAVAEYEAALVGAARRLKASGRHRELRNMAAYLKAVLPARFNPDSPEFAKTT
ncbi:MAG: hypothetical protein Q8R98_22355 [Rubrivivax sp.]|nr:hypothetical protein [Rubrivivax sp.]MDZ4052084.1 hypothetical protein [Phenylobacterium sp.]